MIHGISIVWLGAAAGAVALLTPCVFPMVPITVSYFSKYGGGNRRAAAMNAMLFAGGIIATFTVLGLATALFVGAAGINRFAASPWVNLAIAGMFLAFALSFLGYYELRVPSSIVNRLDRLTSDRASSGGLGALLMGATFAVTTFTCTAPFVGTLLVLASQGEWRTPIVGLFAFSTTFALPFLALALAPRALTRLPRSGGWLNSVKVIFGLIEIGAAIKFVSNADLVLGWGVVDRRFVLIAWAVLCAAIALYLLGRISFPHDAAVARLHPARIGLAAGFIALGAWLGLGLDGRPLGELESFLPPRLEDTPAGGLAAASKGERPDGLQWHVNDLDRAIARARETSRRVFIDFTGYTCTNCRWMESNMFTLPDVEAQLAQFVLARLYTDGEGEEYVRNQLFQEEKFGTVALPFYAVIDDNGRIVATFLGLSRDSAKFLAFLRSGLAS